MSTDQQASADATYRERLDQTRDDLAAAFAYAIKTGDGWDVVGQILGRWTQLQVSALDGAGTSETRTHCRMEAARLMEAIQQRQGMPPLTTE